MTEKEKTAREKEFENTDGETKTLHQIVYYGWREGGDVEQVDNGFVVDGELYTPVDDS
ncbi:hypothetical protein ACEU6E_10650 (plasmid) [Halorutilales archaeon Cl-col2-1]